MQKNKEDYNVVCNFTCNVCNNMIPPWEHFYVCTECSNYDTCKHCYEEKGHEHRCYQEKFTEIYHQRNITNKKTLTARVERIFITYANRLCVGMFNEQNEINYLTYREFHLLTLRFNKILYSNVFREYEEDKKKKREEEEKKKKKEQEGENKFNVIKLPPRNTFLKKRSYRPTKKQPFVVVCAENRLEYLFLDIGCLLLGIATVPIIPNSNTKKIEEIFEKVDPTLVICTNQTKHLFEEQTVPILNIDEIDLNRQFGDVKATDKEIKALSKDYAYESRPEEIYTIMFTSGSTGKPKGALFRNGVWLDRVFPARNQIPDLPRPYINFLFTNLGYCGARETFPLTIFYGARLAVCSHISKIFDQLKIASPTFFTSTPRIFEILFSKFQEELRIQFEKSNKIKKESEKENEKEKENENENENKKENENENEKEKEKEKEKEEIRKELLKKYSKSLGTRLMFLFTGGAKVSDKVFQFLIECFGKEKVHDSFGATEVGTITTGNEILHNVDVKLKNVPEMNYFASEGCGEICVKSPEMISEYWKDEESTKKNFTKDGYFRTGDIGKYIDGKLIIIDRIKDTIKLSQGIFISLNYLEENVFKQSKMIHQLFIYGCSDYSFLVAIIIPTPQYMDSDKEEFKKELIQLSEKSEVSAVEIPKEVYIEKEDFSIENGLLTVAGKKNRLQIYQQYKEIINQMFTSINKLLNSGNNNARMEGYNFNLTEFLQKKLNVSKLLPEQSVHSQGGDSLTKYLITKTVKYRYSLKIPKFLFFIPIKDFLKFIQEPQSRSEIHSKYNNEINWKKLSSVEYWIPEEIKKELISQNKDINENGIENGGKNEIEKEIKNEIEKEKEIEIEKEKGKENKIYQNFKTIFLTGTTGFLGLHILEELLNLKGESEINKVYCLIRGESVENASKRLNTILNNAKIVLNEKQLQKINVLVGDLGVNYFGFSKEKFYKLGNECDLIIHSGAYVDSVLPYKTLERVNVGGTVEIIKLSLIKKTPITYISTISVFFSFPDRIGQYSNPFQISPPVQLDGYTQTKWLSEKLIQKAKKQYQIPIAIFRPSSIFANSKTGYLPKKDFVCRILTGILKMKLFVDDPDCFFDLLPVDFYSKVIVNTTFTKFNQAHDITGINISNPNKISLLKILNYYQESQKITFQKCQYPDFIKKVRNQSDNPLASLYSLFENTTFPRKSLININFLKELLDEKEKELPTITNEMLDLFFEDIKDIIN
ncbi:fatty acid coa synthetase family [Anaeramoeba flamelloides]|uniref:Fatty acid coa synthetase family n=1 Tax=Anaeramoeba flamelloides TaxID=1746091 RepID=A0AAV7YR80_9EUKA|nr:fatty acid coa synthetase family [Anaeramoeba flamelloides]